MTTCPSLALPQAEHTYKHDSSVRNKLYVATFSHSNVGFVYSRLQRMVGQPVTPHLDDSMVYSYLFRAYRGEISMFGKRTRPESMDIVIRRINDSAINSLRVILVNRLKAIRKNEAGSHKHVIRPGAPIKATYHTGTKEVPMLPLSQRRHSNR